MSTIVNYEKTQRYTEIAVLTNSVKVECKTPVLEGDKVLLITPFLTARNNEILDGQIKYTGKAVFNVCVQNANGLTKYECATEFLDTVKDERIKANMQAETSFEVAKIDRTELNGYLIITATVLVKIKLTENIACDYLSSGENLILKSQTANLSTLTLAKSSDTTISEDFEVPHSITEVLLHKDDFIISTVQCGIDCIIIDGELAITLFALQKNQNNDILKESKVLPIRLEVPADGAMPTMAALATATVKDIKLAVTTFEESSSSTVTATVTLSVYGEVFSYEEKPITVDCFSVNEDLEVVKGELIYKQPSAILNFTQKFNERVDSDGVFNDERPVAVVAESLKTVSYELSNGTARIDGIVNCAIFYGNADGVVACRKISFPISLAESVDSSLSCCKVENLTAIVTEIFARQIGDNDIEFYGTVKYSLSLSCEQNIVTIKKVSVVGEKKPVTCAFSVYIALEGEDLWNLSKRLNVSPDELCKSNPELEFPLSGDERIIIYRRKSKEYS